MRIIISFLIGLVLLILLMSKTKLGPFLSMIITTLFIGLACGMEPLSAVSVLNDGIASTCKSLVLVIVFGTVLGRILEKSGACSCIANTMIRIFGEKYVALALSVTGFIVAIPVFADVGLIILAPIVIAIAKKRSSRLRYWQPS